MGNVYGPYDTGDWQNLLILRNNISFYKTDPKKHGILLEKESALYDLFKNKAA